MSIAIVFVVIGPVLVRTVLGGLLQYFLCSKNLKLGLILPILSLVIGLLYELFIVFSALYIADTVVWSILGAVASLVVLCVPPLVYYIIYRTVKKKAQESDINRMKIDDLE
jgi:hypothetical protein